MPPLTPTIIKSRTVDSGLLLELATDDDRNDHSFEVKTMVAKKFDKCKTLSTASKQVFIGPLQNGVRYIVQIRAKNKNGESPWTDRLNVLPLAKPSVPCDIGYIQGNNKLCVCWKSRDPLFEFPEKYQAKFVVVCRIFEDTQQTQSETDIAVNKKQGWVTTFFFLYCFFVIYIYGFALCAILCDMCVCV